MKLSAPFNGLTSAAKPIQGLDNDADCGDDTSCNSEDFHSPYAAARPVKSHSEVTPAELQSPLSLDFTPSEDIGFAYSHANQAFSAPSSMQTYAPLGLQDHTSMEQLDQDQNLDNGAHGLPSPDELTAGANYQPDHYLKLVGSSYSNTGLRFYQPRPIMEEHETGSETKPDFATPEGESIVDHEEQATPSITLGITIPTNSFKSPPPPANIASRRNIPRPAALQVGNMRSRSYNLGPKTGMDGLRRADPTSPATAMRRIASAGGNMAGRIQKSAGPRSPLFLNRNAEAFLQYHSRSPVGVLSAAFAGATPPTPMTPVVMSQSGREPTVSSTCSDDDAFMLGHGIESLKTPPETPGVLGSLPSHFNGHAFNSGMDFAADQPLLTPYFQTEFPDLSLRQVPSYVEMSDTSLPSTPLYTNIITSAAQESNTLTAAANGNAQYDWDANESITSTKSSPGQPRSRQIQFTPNMTPQDYNGVQER